MHNNTKSTDISQVSTHLGWRPLCKYLPEVKGEANVAVHIKHASAHIDTSALFSMQIEYWI